MFLSGIIIFSVYIFSRSLSYDSESGSVLIASNQFLDFGIHLPLIRSFSKGVNFDFQLPFFAGEKLFYHFMFDFYAGVLEQTGLRIDLALNLISTLSLVSLLGLIVGFCEYLFNNRKIGYLSVLFFLFNGSLIFVEFIQKKGIGNIINNIRNYNIYLENAQGGSNIVSVFWNLNTYLNQRQLVFGMAIFLLLVICHCEDPPNWRGNAAISKGIASPAKRDRNDIVRKIIMGLIIGFLPLWHAQVFTATVIFIPLLLIFLGRPIKKYAVEFMFIVIVFAFESLLLNIKSSSGININPGFLISENLNAFSFMNYWIWNLGLYVPILLLVPFLLNDYQRKIFIVSSSLFILPNIIQFSADMFNNHKFFLIWLMMGSVFVSNFILMIFQKNFFGRILSIIFFTIMTASGVLGFFVIKNDVMVRIKDRPPKYLAGINKNNLFMTNAEIYDPVNLSGYKTYFGKEYYIQAYGGEIDKRKTTEKIIFSGSNKREIDNLLRKNKISYIVIYKENKGLETKKLIINKSFFLYNFKKIYENDEEMVFKI